MKYYFRFLLLSYLCNCFQGPNLPSVSKLSQTRAVEIASEGRVALPRETRSWSLGVGSGDRFPRLARRAQGDWVTWVSPERVELEVLGCLGMSWVNGGMLVIFIAHRYVCVFWRQCRCRGIAFVCFSLEHRSQQGRV